MSEPRVPVWWRDRDPDGRDHSLPAARGAAARRRFGASWWGRAWIAALVSSGLDEGRLARGRSYARRDAVLDLEVRVGVVRADVQGTRSTPYRVELLLTPLDPAQWRTLLDVVASRLGHVAALLDGELPTDLVEDAADAGLRLLPGEGDLRPSCSCPDKASPCKHAAAVCYLVADELDRDPFTLLTLRGRGRDAVLEALRVLRAESLSPGPGSVVTLTSYDAATRGDLARDVFRGWDAGRRIVPPTPLPPRRPGRPARFAPDPALGVDPDGLRALARDAAYRAWAALTADEPTSGPSPTGLDLTRDEDLARRAAAAAAGELPLLARTAGVSTAVLTSWAQAWRLDGTDGLRVLVERWHPPALELADARAALARLGRAGTDELAEDRVGVSGNRATLGRLQVRLSVDGTWYLCTKSFNRWHLAAGPAADPTTLLAGMADG